MAEAPGATTATIASGRGVARAQGLAWGWRWAILTAAAMAAAVVLAPRGSTTPSAPLAWLLFVGASVHVASTGWLFSIGDVRRHARAHRGRYLLVPAALVAGGMTLAFVLPPVDLSWILLAFFAWQFHHFQRQNVGIVALSASAATVTRPSPSERRCIVATGACGIVAIVSHPGLVQVGVRPPWAGAFTVALAGFVVASTLGVSALARRPSGDRPPAYCAMTLVALLSPLPIFVFHGPYEAVAGLTLAHGLQYLALVGAVGAGAPHRAREELAVLVVTALVGGTALSALSHTHGSASDARVFFGLYLGVVAAHFVMDAGLWRLGDPAVRGFLHVRLPDLVPLASS